MTVVLPGTDLRWWSSAVDADEALAEQARSLLGPGPVAAGRICPACGSSGHGRPWLRHSDSPVRVSLSRSGPHLVTAIADGPVGVDVESIEQVTRGWRADLVCSARELADPPHTADARAQMWVAKEAILKSLGTGLATPMTEVTVAAYDVLSIDAPAGYAAAVCVGSGGNGVP